MNTLINYNLNMYMRWISEHPIYTSCIIKSRVRFYDLLYYLTRHTNIEDSLLANHYVLF